MNKNRIFSSFMAVLLLFSLSLTAFASNRILRVSVIDAEDPEESASVTDFEDFEEASVIVDGEKVEVEALVGEEDETGGDLLAREEETEDEVASETDESAEEDVCGFNVPEEKTYDAKMIALRRKLRVMPGEEFRVKVFFKNTGSMPWFANKSSCLGPKISLGTERVRDRSSTFYEENLKGWESSGRIAMDQYRTDPGEIGSFTFFAKAPEKPEVYKEYWSIVAKDVQWIDEAEFSFEVMVGNTGESAANLRRKMFYANTSGPVSWIDLNAEKVILVDLSEQMIYAKLGDSTVRQFRASTGAAATPTPTGTTYIKLKQEVRVGYKPPHYIMPKFMWFRDGGYGFHSLPSLGKANSGVFWTEARSHIGIPVSHGCIRLLPEDANWLFDFTEIGTKVVVQK